mmetsp:Transcript_85712/g.229305  ORF Transcript_85712/g.229305 Transcript_85712/m.229305 type:complete len:112 (-) Transcript_85712:93-428(-)
MRLSVLLVQLAAASLCVQNSLEYLILEGRARTVDASVGPTRTQEPEQGDISSQRSAELDGYRKYEPTVRDFSVCTSLDGPYCKIVNDQQVPIVADGLIFNNKGWDVLMLGT